MSRALLRRHRRDDRDYFWNVRQALNTVPAGHIHPPQIERRGERPVISDSQVKVWVPYGFVVIHSSAPGTGLSQGCPTIGTRIEALAPKAVINWLNGRAKGYTTPYGNEEVKAYWTTGKVGMIGTSYNGTIPFAAATTGVEGLEAIIPCANTSYYHYYRSNGSCGAPADTSARMPTCFMTSSSRTPITVHTATVWSETVRWPGA